MSDQRQAAEQRFRFAKKRFSDACKLALLGDRKAEEQSKAAFEEVQKCRLELHRLDRDQPHEGGGVDGQA